MKSKTARKNFHKERIFGLHQNKTDFNYQTEHQAIVHEKVYDLSERKGKFTAMTGRIGSRPKKNQNTTANS